jgi:dolichol-phosphate mannosyltransferase
MLQIERFRSHAAIPDDAPAAADADLPIELTVVAPTFSEAANIDRFVERVGRSLAGIGWEILFVDDDSPDGTSERAASIARVERRVRIVRRIGRRGLASA